jgi:hypothetical protein
MNAQLKKIEDTLNSEYVNLTNSDWTIQFEGDVSDALIEKLEEWLEEGADTEEDFVDEFYHEKAVIEDESASITVLLTHEDSRV